METTEVRLTNLEAQMRQADIELDAIRTEIAGLRTEIRHLLWCVAGLWLTVLVGILALVVRR